ncbi:acid-sensing ion channel 1-like [Alligator mississippiensis]|uniref:Acid-sensing ion channel 1-like n=1 Tax=Alligator mississippiensis TaxID=8496 RepID=A0A151MPE3_ALLMI|nr:acid-sensing ion channel 1-like [Alligator mississippiensis]
MVPSLPQVLAEELWPGPPPAAPRLDEFASRSTLHGLQHIFQRGPFTARNLLWLLAFLALLCLLVDVYAERLGYYFQYPHITQLEEETLPGMVFPAVTLCNLNRARVSQLSSRDLYWAGELLGLLDGADRVLAPEDADVDAGILAALAGRLNLSAEDRARPFDLAELYERTAHRLDLGGMLLNCTFAQEPCSARDFQPDILAPDRAWPSSVALSRTQHSSSLRAGAGREPGRQTGHAMPRGIHLVE